jgi:hypothetical protein
MRRWYAAHLVMYVKYKNRRQRSFPIWENVILVCASSEEEAFFKAEQHGRLHEGDAEGSFTWGGKPSTWVFAGVRKLCLCVDAEKRPGDGTEITYTEMRVHSSKAISALVRGDPVVVQYDEQFND